MEDGSLQVVVAGGRWITVRRVSRREYDLMWRHLAMEAGTTFQTR